jgi:hypothetical protein
MGMKIPANIFEDTAQTAAAFIRATPHTSTSINTSVISLPPPELVHPIRKPAEKI